MAISVDKVYRITLAILNKEQRGILTPDQYNRLGRQAQLDLLEKSFYDYNRALTRRNIQGVNSEYGDIADNIEEQIDSLSKSGSLSFTTGIASEPADLYRIIQITSGTDRTIEVEHVKKSELTYMNASSLTAPSTTYPVYYKEASNIKIFPTTISTATIDYIKIPANPVWAYTGGGGAAFTYDSVNSTDFELHPSLETDLVIKILALAGVVVKDPTVIQVAQQQEANNFNQENI